MDQKIGINDTQKEPQKGGGSIRYVNNYREKISHLEGDDNYTWIHSLNAERPIKATRHLSELLLGIDWLIRIQRKYAVNPAYIQGILRHPLDSSHSIRLTTGQILPISRDMLHDVINQLHELGIEFEYVKRYYEPS